MRQSFLLGLFVLYAGSLFAQDTGTITRHSVLRRAPASDAAHIGTLETDDEVELSADPVTNGYRHVKTEDAEGWVLDRNLRLDVPTTTTLHELQAPIAEPSDHIDETSQKQAPNTTTITNKDKLCGPTGDPGDNITNRQKNRSDEPTSAHDVTWNAIGDPTKLPYPEHQPKSRDGWHNQDAINTVANYEGAAVRTIGWIAVIRPQNKGKGESTNCHSHLAPETDWHIALVEKFGDGENTSMVVETTPRVRRHHQWNLATLRQWEQTQAPVRITGWLMLDPEHTNHLHKYRNTLWEIHPITKIEVWKDNSCHASRQT
jgi:hypothetical protein